MLKTGGKKGFWPRLVLKKKQRKKKKKN